MITLPDKINIGTRGSKLALAQANEVKSRLVQAIPELAEDNIEIVPIITTGDRVQDKNLAEIGGKGLFTKEIEESLQAGIIDIAVHSMKDMPDTLPDGFIIDSILEREDPRDAFISDKAESFEELPEGSVVGTSSVRRQSQILRIRPDLKIVQFRGNVNTRLDKLVRGDVDAIFLANAGLKRLGLEDRITSVVDTDIMLPAVAQGAIGIERLKGNDVIAEIVSRINHQESLIRVSAERSFLQTLGGTCATPIAGLAEIKYNGELYFRGRVVSPDGTKSYDVERTGNSNDAKMIGVDAGKEILAEASDILECR